MITNSQLDQIEEYLKIQADIPFLVYHNGSIHSINYLRIAYSLYRNQMFFDVRYTNIPIYLVDFYKLFFSKTAQSSIFNSFSIRQDQVVFQLDSKYKEHNLKVNEKILLSQNKQAIINNEKD